jgi:long-chain acyl-CoA synthetase
MPFSGPPLDHAIALPDLLGHGLDSKPDDTGLCSLRARWTWRQLNDTCERLARNLLGLGLKPGDRVASLMPNRCELLIHHLACMRAGLVATPLNYRYMAPEIDHALEVAGASALVAHAERDPDIVQCRRAGHLPLGVIRYQDNKLSEHGSDFETLLSEDPGDQPLPAHDPAAPAAIFFTSGSTGPAKGVTHTFDSLRWMFASCAGAFGFNENDVVLPGSSISHLGGFLFSFSALSMGARVAVARSFDAAEILPLLRDDRPTVLCMLPAALFGVIRDGHATRDDFSSLRLCRGGADKVPAELEREFIDLAGFPIDEGYGCTEAGLMALNPPDGVIKIGSVGRPIPGYTLSIRDDDGVEVPTDTDTDGRLWVRSQSTMRGYWGAEAITNQVIRDGWLDTGDMLRRDADGYLWFRGRKKQIIIHDGSNICPQEVEEALLDHPAVASAGVVGVHDTLHGENVRAYVTIRQGNAPPSGRELIEFARARIGYKAPEHIIFLETMPLNPTGKIDRVTLKRMAEGAL